jgi:hypothetical protein
MELTVNDARIHPSPTICRHAWLMQADLLPVLPMTTSRSQQGHLRLIRSEHRSMGRAHAHRKPRSEPGDGHALVVASARAVVESLTSAMV